MATKSRHRQTAVFFRPGRTGRLGAVLASVLSLAAWGKDPPIEPMLAVEVGFHTAMIRRLAVDERRGFAITAGDDKVVRIWSFPELALKNTIRLPTSPGQEGRIYALALNPNGQTVAMGGWTGREWDGTSCVYLYEFGSERLAVKIRGLTNTVTYLTYSKDGRFLAVGLGGASGLRIYRASDYALMMEDGGYADNIVGIDFDNKGRFAVSSLDSGVRLYDENFNLVKLQKLPTLLQPVLVKFSPDGSLLAVGSLSRRVEIWSAKDLSPLFVPEMPVAKDPKDLPGIAWSADGEFLYAFGAQAGPETNRIWRWGRRGQGRVTALMTAARQRLTDLQPLREGGLLYTAEDPLLGMLDAHDQLLATKTPEISDFRGIGENLRVSNDGAVVQFAYQPGVARLAHFSLLEERNIVPGPAKDRFMSAPITSTRALKITDWKSALEPRLNEVPLPPETAENQPSRHGELSRCVAVAPDESRFVLGGEWSLRLYDRGGKQVWVTPLAQIAWGVAWSGDGRTIVAALSDGTLRWYRAEDGREYFALFPHRNGRDWIAWVPEGYYASSEYGDNYVGWQLNRGKSAAADFYQAVQFERVLFRYDLVIAQFASRGAPVETTEKKFDIARLAEFAPAKIKIDRATAPSVSNPQQVIVAFSAEKGGPAMEEFAVFLNNVPVTPGRMRALASSETAAFSREVTLDLNQPENRIRIEVSSGKSIGFVEQDLLVPQVTERPAPPGDLYVLAIGVSQFPALPKNLQLRFAADDADAMAQCLRERSGSSFRQVKTKVLSDHTGEKPDAATIRAALAFVTEAQANDTVVVFLSSHGIASANRTYFFVPRDARMADIDRVITGQADQPPSLVEGEVFFDALRRTAGKRLLIIDTCGGANAGGTVDAKWLKKKSASARFALMVSCGANEQSQEFVAGRQGLFTYALLAGLRAGVKGPGPVRLTALSSFAAPIVREKRENKSLPQTPQLIAPPELADMVLAGPITP